MAVDLYIQRNIYQCIVLSCLRNNLEIIFEIILMLGNK